MGGGVEVCRLMGGGVGGQVGVCPCTWVGGKVKYVDQWVRCVAV